MTTVARHTEWMDDPQVAACLSATSFHPRLLRSGSVTVYFVLPQDKLATFSALMRTWIGCTLRITTQGVASEKDPFSSCSMKPGISATCRSCRMRSRSCGATEYGYGSFSRA